MTKLTKKSPRHDCDIYNESTAFFLSNGKSKGKVDCSSDGGLIEAVEQRQLIAVELDQDDGFIARVVLGELNAAEKNEWFGRGSRRLDLSDGKLAVAGGNAYVSDDESPEEYDDDEFYEVVKVPKGEYLVTVYQHLPNMNSDRVRRLDDWPGIVPYFSDTRPKKPMPDWLAEWAECSGEELPEGVVYGDGDEHVAFVVQLKPVGARPRESALDEDFWLSTELRIPKKCPLGIEPVGIERPEAADDDWEAQEAAEHAARFSDDANLGDTFRPFAEAFFEKRYDDAASFFVPSLRDEVAGYLQAEREAKEKGESLFGIGEAKPCELPPLNDVFRDGEAAETTIPRWSNVSADGGNLFAADTVSEQNYLGEVRCEFGSSDAYVKGKIDLYLMVDTIVVSTDDGPKLAGVVLL